MTEYQFRKYYGPKDDGTSWSEWEDVQEGMVYYSPRTLLMDITELGRIEFRIKPEKCEICDAEEAESSGLCEYHLDVERGIYEDPWPDFHDDDGSGYWNTQEEWEPSR